MPRLVWHGQKMLCAALDPALQACQPLACNLCERPRLHCRGAQQRRAPLPARALLRRKAGQPQRKPMQQTRMRRCLDAVTHALVCGAAQLQRAPACHVTRRGRQPAARQQGADEHVPVALLAEGARETAQRCPKPFARTARRRHIEKPQGAAQAAHRHTHLMNVFGVIRIAGAVRPEREACCVRSVQSVRSTRHARTRRIRFQLRETGRHHAAQCGLGRQTRIKRDADRFLGRWRPVPQSRRGCHDCHARATRLRESGARCRW